MARLIPTRDTLHSEVLEQFEEVQVEMVHCNICGDYHPPDLHARAITPFEPDEPAEA